MAMVPPPPITTPARQRRNQQRQDAVGRVHGYYQVAFILVDFAAAVQFVVGSIMFFYPDWMTFGTWLFLIGSLCFAVKPSLRLARFLHFRRLLRETELTLEAALDPRRFF